MALLLKDYHSTTNPDRYLARVVKQKRISRKVADRIRRHVQERGAITGATEYTISNLVRNLVLMSEDLPETPGTDDVIRMIGEHRRKLKKNTFRLRVIQLQGYLRWLNERGYTEIDLEKIRSVKLPAVDRATKTAEEMLSEDEILRLVDSAGPRDRALIATFYEGGLRTKEVALLTWNQIKFDADGYILNTAEKTGHPRYVRCHWSAPYLAEWQNQYPYGEPAGDRPVFPSHYQPHGPLTYAAIRGILSRVAERAGHTKRIKLGYFRHSHITNQHAAGVPEGIIKLIHWGNLRTTQLDTYSHHTNKDIDNAVLAYAGVEIRPQEKRSHIRPAECPACGATNIPGARLCRVCYLPFHDEAQMWRAYALRLIESPGFYPDFQEWLKNRELPPAERDKDHKKIF